MMMFEYQLGVPIEPFSPLEVKAEGASTAPGRHALVPSLAGQMPDTAVEYVKPHHRKKSLKRRNSRAPRGQRVSITIPQPEVGPPGYSSTSHSWDDGSPKFKPAERSPYASAEKRQPAEGSFLARAGRSQHGFEETVETETVVIGSQAWANRDNRKKQPREVASLSPSAVFEGAAVELDQNHAPCSNRVVSIKESDLFTVPPQTNRPASAPPRRSGDPKIVASGGAWKDVLMPHRRYVVSHTHEPPRGVSNR
eukprot:3442451-Rhodomonas_salina.1